MPDYSSMRSIIAADRARIKPLPVARPVTPPDFCLSAELSSYRLRSCSNHRMVTVGANRGDTVLDVKDRLLDNYLDAHAQEGMVLRLHPDELILTMVSDGVEISDDGARVEDTPWVRVAPTGCSVSHRVKEKWPRYSIPKAGRGALASAVAAELELRDNSRGGGGGGQPAYTDHGGPPPVYRDLRRRFIGGEAGNGLLAEIRAAEETDLAEAKRRNLAFSNIALPPLNYCESRSRYMDGVVSDALAGTLGAIKAATEAAGGGCQPVPIKQVLLLGCGMCTRAWRLSCLLTGGVRVFDVEERDIINWKDQCMEQAGTAPVGFTKSSPPRACGARVSVGTDFGLPRVWAERLLVAGFDSAVATVVVCEGCIPFMGEEQGAQMLSMLNRITAPGSVLTVDIANAYSSQRRDRTKKNARGEEVPRPCPAKAVNRVAEDYMFPVHFGTDFPLEFLSRAGWASTEMCTIATKQLDFISETTGQRLVPNDTLETHLAEAPPDLPQSWYLTSYRKLAGPVDKFKSVSDLLGDDPEKFQTFGRDPRLGEDQPGSKCPAPEVCSVCCKTHCARCVPGGKIRQVQRVQAPPPKVEREEQSYVSHRIHSQHALPVAPPAAPEPPKPEPVPIVSYQGVDIRQPARGGPAQGMVPEQQGPTTSSRGVSSAGSSIPQTAACSTDRPPRP